MTTPKTVTPRYIPILNIQYYCLRIDDGTTLEAAYTISVTDPARQ